MLDGKVALVTGASRGIGRAIALELGKHGASVVVNYRERKEQADEVVHEIKKMGSKAIAIQADVTKPEQVDAMVGQVVKELGQVYILVNNAGTTADRTLRRMSKEEWLKVIDTNLNGVFYVTSRVVQSLEAGGGGHIIMLSSIIGEMGNAGLVNYGSTKAALIGFTKSAAQELVRFNILVNAVAPGFIETDMIVNLPDEARQTLLDKTPMRRFGRPEEVATMVRYLVTEGTYITGQVFNINGGMYM
ncbi:MAG: 3-oxoacyl-ACP reductase FabG [Dehalococcoidia bacterium]|nr:3-oxoacyl-ACP reductase FabG [Dehalococcoidia bacterium]